MQQPKTLRVVVLRMEPNMVYEMELLYSGSEPTLKHVIQQNADICSDIFSSESIDFGSLSIFRKQCPKENLSYSHMALHILMCNLEGAKLQRNPNAFQIEYRCATQFFGPLVIAFNSMSPPYSLCNFTITDLKELQDIHQFIGKPLPLSVPSLYSAQIQSNDYARSSPNGIEKLEDWYSALDMTTFYTYRYKTAYCPNLQGKHDWAKCMYAHRVQDFRRSPDKFHYLPEDCPNVINSSDECSNGKLCKFSHTKIEKLYHPMKYKTVACECNKKKKECPRGSECAFYHNFAEKRNIKRIELTDKLMELQAVDEKMKFPQLQSFSNNTILDSNTYSNELASTKPAKSISNECINSFLTIEEKLRKEGKVNYPCFLTK